MQLQNLMTQSNKNYSYTHTKQSQKLCLYLYHWFNTEECNQWGRSGLVQSVKT